MVKRFACIAGIVFWFAISGYAYGALIVDTGQPPIDPNTGIAGAGPALLSTQFLAGKISLSGGATITGIQTFGGSYGGNYTIALYADQGTIPKVGDELFSSTAFWGSNFGMPDWSSASSLNWHVAAGSYWVAFEVRPGQTFSGYLTRDLSLANPLSAYAYFDSANGGWLPDIFPDGSPYAGSLDSWALRVEGSVTPVPLPGSLWFLVSGLTGFAAYFRRERTKPRA